MSSCNKIIGEIYKNILTVTIIIMEIKIQKYA